MSLAHFSWSPTGSTESPMIFTFLRSNSSLMLAMYPSSVVHTGVKSLGCEKSTAHESPIQSWKRIRPSVVSASKSGAVSPICSAMFLLLPTESDPTARLREDEPLSQGHVYDRRPPSRGARRCCGLGGRRDRDPAARLLPQRHPHLV